MPGRSSFVAEDVDGSSGLSGELNRSGALVTRPLGGSSAQWHAHDRETLQSTDRQDAVVVLAAM